MPSGTQLVPGRGEADPCTHPIWCPVPAVSGACPTPTYVTGPTPWEASVGCRDWMQDEWCPGYNGVPFAVHSDMKSGGRRIHIHEYPSREYWDNEDMGRLRQMVDVQAYVFGDQCDVWAEMLFAACVAFNPAVPNPNMTPDERYTLWLPQRPPVKALCLSVESTSTEDKGTINFSMRFVLQTGEPAGLVQTKKKTQTQSRTQVDSAAQNVTAQSRMLFESGFTGNQNQMARNQASLMMQRVVTQTRKTMAQARVAPVQSTQINFNLQRIQGMSVEITDLQKSVPDVLTPQSYTKTQRRADIVAVPQEGFGALMEDNMDLLVHGSTSLEDLRQALLPMTTLRTKDLVIQTQSVRDYSTLEELLLAEEIAALTRRLSLALSCRAVTRSNLQYQSDVVRIRNSLTNRIDNEAFLASTDDPTYTALRNLRSMVIDFIANFSAGGITTKKYKFNSLMPVAVYAANIYPYETGDKDRDVQITKLNNIDHPMFPQTARVFAYRA